MMPPVVVVVDERLLPQGLLPLLGPAMTRGRTCCCGGASSALAIGPRSAVVVVVVAPSAAVPPPAAARLDDAGELIGGQRLVTTVGNVGIGVGCTTAAWISKGVLEGIPEGIIVAETYFAHLRGGRVRRVVCMVRSRFLRGMVMMMMVDIVVVRWPVVIIGGKMAQSVMTRRRMMARSLMVWRRRRRLARRCCCRTLLTGEG
mmetsp:Transcript_10836/g.26764  ORF Transcript_10836/g.26764 Transcript_10836/m.26764 type:complete len:202 (+) Transcript_10836:1053-1658(+)